MGFTESVDLNKLSSLAKKKKITLLLDLGSGAIADFHKLGFPHEPTVLSYLKSGASVVSFSGDKLLGGPQAGIICGKKSLIQKIHRNPLYRALRCDKFSFAILEAILRTYLTSTKFHNENMSMELFNRSQKELINLGNKIIKRLSPALKEKYMIAVIPTDVEAGSGSLPLENFPSAAIVFKGGIKASELSRNFRMSENPVLGYITGNRFHIDLKAIPPTQEKRLLSTLVKILK
jgi:L-seryl-tRNA(Ser) seleniumtransferase